MAAQKKACLRDGYAYQFDGKRNWNSSKDDRWDIVMLSKTHCGTVVGKRRIDGSTVNVIRVRGRYYAAQPHAFKRR